MKALFFLLIAIMCVSCGALREARHSRDESSRFGTDFEGFKMLVDLRLKKEAQGYPPEGGKATHVEFYRFWFETLRKGGDEGERRVRYIQERRKQMGLPDVE